MRLCRERLEFKQEVILGIHSNVAGDENSYDAGHAWVTVTTVNQVFYLGLWPDGHPRVIEKREECSDVRIGFEARARPAVSRYYKLNMTQVGKLNQYINRPTEWGLRHNCAKWATALLGEVLGISVSAVDYLIFSTPRELGRVLQGLEKKHPTAFNLPNNGAVIDQVSSWGM